ncbi:MAG: DUF896 domain-containing protein [Clostridia bacterium]|nr:DUF896 domain-containing protein [Clostridia bacterium]
MITETKIKRINELARKSKAEGLTPAEKEEQKKLRGEYVAAFRRSLRAELDNTYIVNPDGTKTPVKDRKKKS